MLLLADLDGEGEVLTIGKAEAENCMGNSLTCPVGHDKVCPR